MSGKTSRRQFLKTSSLLTTGAAAVGGLTLAQSANVAGSDLIKLALVGCGGRGSGAIRDRVQVGDNVKVIAVADVFEGQAKNAANSLRNGASDSENMLHEKVDLPEDQVFWGLDAYKKAIACLNPGDQVVLATPPGFRPYQYRAAVEQGCHVFMEKPIFIDAPGFHHTMETNRMADAKNLKVCVGFHYRAEPRRANWVEQIHAGKIGEVQYTRVFFNDNGIWVRNREPGEGELNFQIRNWFHFQWVCGDNMVEQHVHNIDIGNWVHSKGDRMGHPVSANAQGGRTFKTGREDLMRQAPPFADRQAWDAWYQRNRQAFFRHGTAWDHFFTEFTYADGSRMYSQARHIRDTWTQVSEFACGTEGHGFVGDSAGTQTGQLFGRDGQEIWRNTERAPKGGHQLEHDLHVKTIRDDTARNDGYFAAMSTMTAILGREAAFSGRVVTWDDLVEKGRPYHPNGEITSFDQEAWIQPDTDGFYESSVPVPGVYSPFAS